MYISKSMELLNQFKLTLIQKIKPIMHLLNLNKLRKHTKQLKQINHSSIQQYLFNGLLIQMKILKQIFIQKI